MKKTSKKLTLHKLKIAKLENLEYIRGGLSGDDGGDTVDPDPPYSDEPLNPDCWFGGDDIQVIK